MRDKLKKIIPSMTAVVLGIAIYTAGYDIGKKKRMNYENISFEIKQDSSFFILSDLFSMSPKDGLREAMEYFEMECPDIVYAQAVLETGNFKSRNCIEKNNLFGLYDSKNKRYYTFSHWIDCVIAYKLWIQSKYDVNENYYAFLKRIGYAEDPKYNSHLKRIMKANKKRFN